MVITAAAVGTATAWAAGQAADATAGQSGTLRVAFSTFGRETFDPGSDSGVSQQQSMNQIYDQLLDFAPDGGIGPVLAEEWTISPDGTPYTAPVPAVEELARGADVLVAMCGGSQARQRAHGTDFGQMGTTWAGELAQRAAVGTMVLTHMGPHFRPGSTMEQGIREIAAVYDGRIIVPHELMRIPLTGGRDEE